MNIKIKALVVALDKLNGLEVDLIYKSNVLRPTTRTDAQRVIKSLRAMIGKELDYIQDKR